MVHEITLFCLVVMGACMLAWLLIFIAYDRILGWRRADTTSLIYAGVVVLVPSAVALIVMVGAMFIASLAETIAWLGTLL